MCIVFRLKTSLLLPRIIGNAECISAQIGFLVVYYICIILFYIHLYSFKLAAPRRMRHPLSKEWRLDRHRSLCYIAKLVMRGVSKVKWGEKSKRHCEHTQHRAGGMCGWCARLYTNTKSYIWCTCDMHFACSI